MTKPTAKLSPHGKAPAEGYASAVKEIEQEKQMVAALKRLSFGHLLNTDPDALFPEDLANFDDYTNGADFGAGTNAETDDNAETAELPPPNLSPHNSPEKKPSGATDARDQAETDDTDEANTSATLDTPIDATPFWVPANAHPEINPHQFKSHVQNTIDVLLERKLLRSKSTRSKRSSLLLSTTEFSLPETPEPPSSAPPEPTADPANPSLRVLTSELEELLRLAGMSASDAVTLARSLSTSSLGYTDAEMQAFDDMGQGPAPRANHAELLDLGPEERPRSAPRSHSSHSPQSPRSPHSSTSSDDFSLRRSRRLDYRKPHGGALGSQLQSRKAENLAELRSTLTSTPTTASPRDSLNSINPRSSQILFSYRGPAKSAPPQTSLPQRPLPTHAAGHSHHVPPQHLPNKPRRSLLHENVFQDRRVSPISTKSTDDLISGSDRLYGQRRVSPKMRPSKDFSGQGQGQSSPNQGQSIGGPNLSYYGHGHRYRNPESNQRHMRPSAPQSNAKKGAAHYTYPGPMSTKMTVKKKNVHRYDRPDPRPDLTSDRPDQSDLRPEILRPKKTDKRSKTRELNQNLDLLRTEINEFKESLSKTDPVQEHVPIQSPETSKPKEQKQEKPVAHEDFSFDLSSHDVSYEDSLGLEKDILDELHVEKSKPATVDTVIQSLEKTETRLLDAPALSWATLSGHPLSKSEKREQRKPDAAHVTIAPFDTNTTLGHNGTAVDTEVDTEVDTVVDNAVDTAIDSEFATAVDNVDHPTVDIADNFTTEIASGLSSEVPAAVSENPVAYGNSPPDTLIEKSRNKNIVIPEIEEKTKLSHTLPTFAIANHTQQKEEKKIPSFEKNSETNKLRKKKSFGALTKNVATEKPEKKSFKKGWLWSKERSVSTSVELKSKQEPGQKVSTRAISSPELLLNKKHKNEQGGKENVISKLFKKKRSNSVSSEKSHQEIVVSKRNLSSTTEENENELKAKILRKISNKSVDDLKNEEILSVVTTSRAEQKEVGEKTDAKGADEKVKSILRSTFKKKNHDTRQEISEQNDVPERKIPEVENREEIPEVDEDSAKPQTTQEVQEKLKKSIKRTSRPNQPIEFTDSAFGFPLPPPSQSTLVMIDHRFPVHVERAIYRLSHLKLANPKRSLREQVLLSNFMYAYLNLVDHTLHLEQQLSLEEQPLEQPEAEMELFNAEDPDTEFEIDDDLDESTFDTIKLDLDAQENRISV